MQIISPIITDLWNKNEYVSAITILTSSNNEIIYQTDNWDISYDIGNIMSTWSTEGSSIEILGIRYSTLQCTPERIVATNVRGQGHIIAAKGGKIIGVVYLLPGADVGGSYMDVARCVGTINLQIGSQY